MKKTEKKIRISWGKIGILTLVLTMMTSGLMVGTFAKYTSSYSGSGIATVAKWTPQFKNGSNTITSTTFTVDIKDTTLNSKVVDAKIAPGTDGSFDIKIDPNGTEVAFDYKIELDISGASNIPTNLKFYSDSSFSTELSSGSITGTMPATGGTAETETIYWKWAYETSNGDDDDTADGSDTGNLTMTVPITLTATQKDPS